MKNNIIIIIFIELLSLCLSGSAEAKDCSLNPQNGYAKHYSHGCFCFMENQEEIWKDIIGYEGQYQVSNIGRVKSLTRKVPVVSLKRKQHSFSMKERIKKSKIYFGYNKVFLSKNAKYKWHTVHGLVATAFIREKKDKEQVNHINGIKHDNRVENLEWVTAKENYAHALKTGLVIRPKGESNKKSIPVYQYSEKGELINKYASAYEAELIGGFYNGSIGDCCKGRQSCHKGFIWSYKQLGKILFKNKVVRHVETNKRIAKIDANGNVVAIYNSLKEIGEHHGAVGDCCRGKKQHHKGFKYQYYGQVAV